MAKQIPIPGGVQLNKTFIQHVLTECHDYVSRRIQEYADPITFKEDIEFDTELLEQIRSAIAMLEKPKTVR